MRFIVACLTTIIAVSSVCYANTTTDKINSNKEKISELKDSVTVIKNEALGIDKEIAGLMNELLAKQKEIDKVQSNVDALQKNIDALVKSIKETESDIKVTEDKITETESIYNEKERQQSYQQEVLRNRLKRNYINNTYSEFLGIMLDSESLSEVMFKMKYIREIINSDKDIITQLEETKQQLAETKAILDAEKESLSSKKVSLENQKAEIESKQTDLNNEIAILNEEYKSIEKIEDEKQSKLSNLKARQKSMENQIQDLTVENESLRKAMEEASTVTNTGSVNSNTGSNGLVVPTGQFIKPTSGRYTSMYGYRTHPITGKRSFHSGIDIANSSGTAIVASDSGTVTRASYYGAYGNTIVINHGNGYSTQYSHLSSYNVSVGDTVTQGQRIGSMGNTGWSTGPHLHFEIWKNGSHQNPLNYIS